MVPKEVIEEEIVGMSELQQEDTELQDLIQKAKSRVLGKKPDTLKFALIKDVLWYVDSAWSNRARLVVPRSLQQQLLEEVHSGPYAGHFAVKSL